MAEKRGVKVVKEQVVPAPLWKRVFAYFIDVMLINFVIVLPFRPLLLDAPSGSFSAIRQKLGSSFGLSSEMAVVVVIIAALSILYWSVFEFKLGQSIGKMAFNIFVSSQRQQLTFGQCVLRNLSKISTLVLAADALFIILTKGHQRYLERVSATEVVEKRWVI